MLFCSRQTEDLVKQDLYSCTQKMHKEDNIEFHQYSNILADKKCGEAEGFPYLVPKENILLEI